MGPIQRLRRELKFLTKLARVFWRIRHIDPESGVLDPRLVALPPGAHATRLI